MEQLSFLSEGRQAQEELGREQFSHGGVCPEEARRALEEKYSHLLEETDEFDRQLVSFQANKTETLHSWIKYREGFSAELVEILIEKFGIERGDAILDPFAGSSTTLLVSKMLGIDAVGIELLAHCHLAWEAKSRVFDYDAEELRNIRELVREETPPPTDREFKHLRITRTAFSEERERDLMAYTAWFETLDISDDAKTLCRFLLTSVLERISFTRKDGQYLRWDRRAQKIRERNQRRTAKGKEPIKGIHKGELPSVKEAFLKALSKVIIDVDELQRDPPAPSEQRLIKGNTLYELPGMEADRFAAVITSPPYANRYDYTRTYALEEAYLGIGEEIFDLRQRQLSCTVENKSKLEELEECYRSIDQQSRYEEVLEVVEGNEALAEINAALRSRNELGEINNTGILRMIDQYFTELTFVFAELRRVCRDGAYVVFVNDNVRYAGEVIPVDLLTTELAEQVGFEAQRVWVLPQRKGNSSQQMQKYGRTPLRKSITVWRKPTEEGENMPSNSSTGTKRDRWLIDQVTKSEFFHQKLHEYGLLEIAYAIENVAGEHLAWNRDGLGISADAWKKVIHRGIQPVRVFAHPWVLRNIHRSVGYYQKLALVSLKSMTNIGLTIAWYESGQNKNPMNRAKAEEVSHRLNKLISRLIESDDKIDPREFDLWRGMTAGSSAQGSWQNAKGDRAEDVVKGMIRRRIQAKGLLKDEAGDNQALHLKDGRTIILGSEPDVGVYGKSQETLAAVEIKGGIDTAGVLERIGAVIKSLSRAKQENPDSVTLLVIPRVSMTEQARQELDVHADDIDHCFMLEELLEVEQVKRELFDVLGI